MKKKIMAYVAVTLMLGVLGCSNGKGQVKPTEDTKPVETETTGVETVGKDAEVASSSEETTKKDTTKETTTKKETTAEQTTTKQAETTTKAQATTTKQPEATTKKTSSSNGTQAAPSNKPSGVIYMDINVSINANNEAERIIGSIIDSNMSEYERVKAIHDWIVINVQYDYAGLQNNSISRSAYNADGVFFYKLAVCEGYAEAFQLLCAKAGVQAYMMYGEAGNSVDGWDSHAWNVVRIDGQWYQIDCTWDDPLVNGAVVTGSDNLTYTYFLLTDEEMYYDHKLDKDYTKNEQVCNSRLFYGYAKNLTLQQQVGQNVGDIKASTAAQAQEIAKNYAKTGQYNFKVVVLETVTNAQQVIQQGICDGLVEAGVEGNIQIGYSYQQVFDYFIYEVTITIN